MKEKTPKNPESELLNLLKTILPKAAPDPVMAEKIYDAFANELKNKNRAQAFAKFCNRMEIPSFDKKNIEDVKAHLVNSFRDGDITLKPSKEENVLMVEVALPDGTQFSNRIKVNPDAKPPGETEGDGEQEIKLKFVPFPVSLPGDKELVWVLAKHETLTPEEGSMMLSKLEEAFWETKAGQNLIKKGTERSFPEFVANVPSSMLTDAGLKRHYKLPEPVKVLQPALTPPPKSKAKKVE